MLASLFPKAFEQFFRAFLEMKVIVLITLFIFPLRPCEAVRQRLPSSTTPISAQINNHEGLGVEQEFLNKIVEAREYSTQSVVSFTAFT